MSGESPIPICNCPDQHQSCKKQKWFEKNRILNRTQRVTSYSIQERADSIVESLWDLNPAFMDKKFKSSGVNICTLNSFWAPQLLSNLLKCQLSFWATCSKVGTHQHDIISCSEAPRMHAGFGSKQLIAQAPSVLTQHNDSLTKMSNLNSVPPAARTPARDSEPEPLPQVATSNI